jgi:translation initiation factor 2A
VAWTPDGEQFIVISGNQPATATLYDKNCQPLFEFGKRFRNTIRICPFSQLVLIGGFGALKGAIDFWSLDTLEEVGTAKSDCAIDIEWSSDGKSIITSVLWERVKVDNILNLFTGCGKKILPKGAEFGSLNFAQLQPSAPGTFKKPSIAIMQKEAADDPSKKAKRSWGGSGGGGGGAFAQIMR